MIAKGTVFRVRKKYFDEIVAGTKNVEYRKDSTFWLKRAFSDYQGHQDLQLIKSIDYSKCVSTSRIAIFICGKQVHRRKILYIERTKTPATFSEQGKRDVDTPTCFAFHLGEVVEAKPC